MPIRVPGAKKKVRGGVKRRALDRAEDLGMKNVKRGGVTKGEAQKVRSRWLAEKRGKGGNGPAKNKPTGPKTFAGEPINRLVDAEANLEYGRAEELAGREIRREQAHQTTIGQAFDNYKTRLDGLIQAQTQANVAAGQQLGQNAALSAGAAAGMGAQSQAEVAERAKLLGFGGESAAKVESTNQQVAAYNAGANVDRQKLVQAQGLADVGDLVGRAAIGERSRIQELTAGQSRERQARKDLLDLKTEKRQFRTKRRGELMDKGTDQYLAILGLRQKALSDREDRELRERLGLAQIRGENKDRRQKGRLARLQRQHDAKQKALDRAQESGDKAKERRLKRELAQLNADIRLATDDGGGGGGGGGSSGGLSPSAQGEWNQKKNEYLAAAERLKRNLKKFKDRDSAWHQTAQDLGGRMTRQEMNAIWHLAKGGKLPQGVIRFLRSEFPGGKSPWG